MKVLGYPYTAEDLKTLDGKTEMDALVAYLLRFGQGAETVISDSRPGSILDLRHC